jgi:DNA helicase-2/ATP-dependent DNA helicase PcrA
MHENFGVGLVTNIFGEGKKISLGIKFGKSQKIIDPKIASMTKLD